jgi:hypothetical protein
VAERSSWIVRYAVPGITAVVGFGLQVPGFTNPVLGFGLIAVGFVWAVVAFFIHRRSKGKSPASPSHKQAVDTSNEHEPRGPGVAPGSLRFSFDKAVVELVGDDCLRDGHQFRSRSVVWITVKNDGAEAEFSAWFSLRINTARREYPSAALVDDYADDVAWENVKTRKNTIGHNGQARLMPIWSFIEAPGLFWFLLPQKDLYGQDYASGWVLRPIENHIDVDLRVTNETTGESVDRTSRLTFDEHGRAVSLDWVDLSNEPDSEPVPMPVPRRARGFLERKAALDQLYGLRAKVHLLEPKVPATPFSSAAPGFNKELADLVTRPMPPYRRRRKKRTRPLIRKAPLRGPPTSSFLPRDANWIA